MNGTPPTTRLTLNADDHHLESRATSSSPAPLTPRSSVYASPSLSATRRLSREQAAYSTDECPVLPTVMPPKAFRRAASIEELQGGPVVVPLLSARASLTSLREEAAVPLPPPNQSMTHHSLPRTKSTRESQAAAALSQPLSQAIDPDAQATAGMVSALSARFEGAIRDLSEKMEAQSSLLERMFEYIQRIDKESEATSHELANINMEMAKLRLNSTSSTRQ
ncbi:hypothetical protein BCR33DRAFT_713528 [Rhizoclosmatium globosum]|uniref:Uncharacterized protein n=1 Tax=Rhizoclosmatium globosum TaxID=329046 RepID=A0A1Y2CSH9_9FUNG|nr:hypothetical protein BCR33DRAFT_713528 [Rhizoclosmatium globosum]|eukprot:ORY49927.1 hypothetical protein BCR33DRAFT_713528 [Rhizoclosmatium globosum]